jgi:hypothetical protein
VDWDIPIKLVTVVAGVVASGKVLYDMAMMNHSRMRDEFTFARDFLALVASNKNMHPFLRESGYQAIAGDRNLSADVIEYLLSLHNASQALRDYVLGRAYLERLVRRGDLRIRFRGRYRYGRVRWSMRALYLTLYVVLALGAAAPVILSSVLFKKPSDAILPFMFSLSVFGSYAWMSLKAAVKLSRAERLVQNQHQHTQYILIDGLRDFGPR